MKKIAVLSFIIFIFFIFLSAYEMRGFGEPSDTKMDDRIIGEAREVKIEKEEDEIIFTVGNEAKILEAEKTNIENFTFYVEGEKIKINMENETVDEISKDELPYRKIFWLYGAVKETGANNAVTSVVFDYRGYDTLGEATVLFAAIAGVLTLFRREKNERR